MQAVQSNLNSYIYTKRKETCTGCGACVNSCRHNALLMEPDSEGFLYPQINPDKCIQCGLCNMVCPVTNCDTANKSIDQHCYIATTTNESFYKDSASIGICTMLSMKMLSIGGVVFGSYLDENTWSAYHIKVDDKEGIQKIRNSKYLQSSTLMTFTQVKELLKQRYPVLYIGTPCQIAGLKSFLRKQYENLYTIDLICHGVFSPKLMPYEVMYWERKFGGKVKNFRFRSKRVYKAENGGMVNFDIVKDYRINHIERFAASSPSYRCYAYAGDGLSYNQRLSCYSCPFRATKRYADITVGDPWFVSNDNISDYDLKSTNVIRSLISINTNQGLKIYSMIKNELVTEELSREKSFCQPAVLKAKRIIPAERSILYKELDNVEYGKLVERLLNCNLDKAHIKYDFNYKKKEFKRVIKKYLLGR